jgi:DNA-directed RNA polymerase omega subunit
MKSEISTNKFIKVMVATQRAKQIHQGARPLVQCSSTRATRIALEEVEQGLIGFEFILEDPDLKSGRANRADRGRDDIGEDNCVVTNQPSVASETFVTVA